MGEIQESSGYCSVCNKPITSQRSGSLTGWIFGGSKCNCILRNVLSTTMMFGDSQVDRDEQLPVISDRYEARQVIEKGGMANVYKVWDSHLEKYSVLL